MISRRWHNYLNMPKRSASWHSMDLSDELNEYRAATSLLNKWSEASDVVYTCTRARWSGHKLKFPLGAVAYMLGSVYMYPKYTLRYRFFRKAGNKMGTSEVREVRNPRKVLKLREIAANYDLSPKEFEKICKKQLKYWPLLP